MDSDSLRIIKDKCSDTLGCNAIGQIAIDLIEQAYTAGLHDSSNVFEAGLENLFKKDSNE